MIPGTKIIKADGSLGVAEDGLSVFGPNGESCGCCGVCSITDTGETAYSDDFQGPIDSGWVFAGGWSTFDGRLRKFDRGSNNFRRIIKIDVGINRCAFVEVNVYWSRVPKNLLSGVRFPHAVLRANRVGGNGSEYFFEISGGVLSTGSVGTGVAFASGDLLKVTMQIANGLEIYEAFVNGVSVANASRGASSDSSYCNHYAAVHAIDPPTPPDLPTDIEFDNYNFGACPGPKTISYQTTYSNTAVQPSGTNDWRIEQGTPATIPGLTTGIEGTPTFSPATGPLPPGCGFLTNGDIFLNTAITAPTISGSCSVKVEDDNGESTSPVYYWEFIGSPAVDDDRLYTLQTTYSNDATSPSGTYDWRIVDSTTAFIPATITGNVGATTFFLVSGSFPPGMELDTSGNLEITAPLSGPSTTGAIVLKYTDDVGDVQTIEYIWEYIGS